MKNPSYRCSLKIESANALVPDNIMKTIVESAKVSAALRDLYIQEVLTVPVRMYNPSRRDSC